MPSSTSDSMVDEALVIAGPKYKNVSHPTNCVIAFIYSKSSIVFLCLIGCFTTISTYLFTTQFCFQIAKSNLLCMFNDYLPRDEELLEQATPTRYYCRFLEGSCYVLLGLSIVFGVVFLSLVAFLDYEQYIVPSVSVVLRRVVYKDRGFCTILEPLLACRVPTNNQTDLIEDVCNAPRRHLYLADNCVHHLTGFLDRKSWLITLLVLYSLLLVVGLVIVVRSAVRTHMKRRRGKAPARVIVMNTNDQCGDNQHIILSPSTEL
ncbi:hypothetical protein M3Y99_01380700 [Aphelenchoides fujianensis]|nr:hypothetical protein M3Y99_01380700 [Aphelenchoides fujianensis]